MSRIEYVLGYRVDKLNDRHEAKVFSRCVHARSEAGDAEGDVLLVPDTREEDSPIRRHSRASIDDEIAELEITGRF